jgi:hypothetical protein
VNLRGLRGENTCFLSSLTIYCHFKAAPALFFEKKTLGLRKRIAPLPINFAVRKTSFGTVYEDCISIVGFRDHPEERDMTSDQSIVKKTESAIDDLVDLWRRRKLVCTIVITIIVIPVAFSLYLQFVAVPKLKDDISQKQQSIQTLKDSVQNAEKERDKAEIKLAPFLAIANQRFPDIPSDKRLELLLAKLDQAIVSVQDAARRVSSERSLTPQIQSSLVTNLKMIPSLDVEVTCVLGDTEGFALASQIKNVFEKAEWKVNGVNQAIFNIPVKHLVLTFGKEPSLELQRTISILFDSLSYPREATLDKKLGENALKIVVGSK